MPFQSAGGHQRDRITEDGRWYRSGGRDASRGPASIVSTGSCRSSRTSAAHRDGAMGRSAVDRMACVDLPAFPLQLLMRRHPVWA